MITLGIETSCDETALALLETKGDEYRVIDSLIHSQAELHSAYGGVFPTLAKREHGKNLIPLFHKIVDSLPIEREIEKSEFDKIYEEFCKINGNQNPELIQALKSAHFLLKVPHIDRIAVTEGPGLEPALWVGINFAIFLSSLWKIPVIPVNHMEGHIVGSLLDESKARGTWQKLKKVDFPALALLISGGHTELVNIEKIGSYSILGQTKDDAVGEAFDKTARLLDLPYPGGPHISLLAEKARQEKISPTITLPRPMKNSGDFDFSFSGLKTAVLYAVRKALENNALDDNFKKGLALEFENAVGEVLDFKLRKALEETGAQTIIIGGGVIANQYLRSLFTKTTQEFRVPLLLPDRHISGDNALMIALAGSFMISNNERHLRADGTKRLT